MTTQHAPAGHWGVNNPIPNIQRFVESLDKDKRERDRRIDEEERQKRQAEREGGAVPHAQQDSSKHKGTRKVTDPTTGKEVEIEDVGRDLVKESKDPDLSVPNANLNKPTPIKTEPTQPLPEYKHNQDVTAPPDPIAEGTTSDVPIRGEKTNVLFHPTPSITYQPMFETLEKRATGLCIATLIGIIFVGKMFGGSLWGLIPLASIISSGTFLWMKEVIRSGREMEWSSEQLRGETATANLLPESVEWMNTFLTVAWGLMNPDMFSGIADTIEDIMQASVPGVIENVRVAEIDQGNNPIRILSLRALPDSHVKQLQENAHEENKKNKDPQAAAADEEGGDYYNLEVSFAYHAKPSEGSTASKARNMHMELVFYLGVKGLFGVPLPVFAELIEMVGTVRLRLQMTPEPPFAKNLTFSFMGLPHIRAGCTPMVRSGVNILNLPLISNFVNYAIGAAASLYVAPKSMSLDLSMLLKGDDIQKDTDAIGVMWVRIHRAIGLSKQDKRGSEGGGSDPYINLSFSKYGKPMYCTRVITDDLNPIWEETAALLVTPELIKADEQLSVELWDSDRNTADDIVGKIEVSIQEMIQHPGRMFPQVSKLQGMEAGSEMPGELHWEVGFFGKPKLRPQLRTDGQSTNLPDTLKDNPKFQDEKGVITSDEEDAVVHTPPDPLWPSGICSIVIHQIVNLQLENIQGSKGNRKNREYEPAKPYGENIEEQGKELPNSYCTILLNDNLVYRTRSKAVSSKPIFNAGTERFVRDWRSAVVTVTVRDQRHREHDPILGVVPLKLSDILRKSSQVTRWYPLDGGIGFGRIRISLLFRSVETRLPPNMLGWDVGTFQFTSDRVTAENYAHYAKIKLRTGGSTGKISKTVAHVDGGNTYYDLNRRSGKDRIKLPVKHRYRSPVVFEFHNAHTRGTDAYAVLWLQHLVDGEDTQIDIPIWTTKNGRRLTQNYVTEENWKAKEVPGLEDLQEVGRLKFSCKFTAGIDESHESFVVDNDSRETFETWETCVAEGVRERHVPAEIPDEVQQLHEKSLVEGRDILKKANPEEQKLWLDKQGHDWSGAFGQDPRAYTDSFGRKAAEPGVEKPPHDPIVPPPVEKPSPANPSELQKRDGDAAEEEVGNSDSSETSESEESSNLTSNTSSADSEAPNGVPRSTSDINKQNKRAEHRQQRGLMQWKPVRNAVFAKDEAKFALRKVKRKIGMGDLTGREPDVETETRS
ncbi:hypothetical protein DTO027B5_4179 [Paecilomyces variotii]|nr:hypothetical protein DTO027B3_4614 [Paecilomyces variotii]KAJ9334056.1 hypothetical protein DTO027B5_4179 [Paecilomyces variotii]KAJ9410704.1 hypothetical protein DTO045G8_1610 [Paecilomyces variotii]